MGSTAYWFFFLIVKFINAVHFTNKGPLHAKAPPIIILVFFFFEVEK